MKHKDYNRFIKSVEREIDSLNLSNTEITQERLYKMIEYAIGRFDYYESIRESFLKIALSLIGLTAGAGLLLYRISENTQALSDTLGVLSIITLLITGFSIVVFYWSTTAEDYPHRKFSDIRSWYFIYSLPDDLPIKLSCDPEIRDQQINKTGDAFVISVKNWLEYGQKEDGFIKEDLQQVFILHYLQKSRRDSIKKMKSALFIGLSFFLGLLIPAISISISHNLVPLSIVISVVLVIFTLTKVYKLL